MPDVAYDTEAGAIAMEDTQTSPESARIDDAVRYPYIEEVLRSTKTGLRYVVQHGIFNSLTLDQP
jgi:hypothetical protein